MGKVMRPRAAVLQAIHPFSFKTGKPLVNSAFANAQSEGNIGNRMLQMKHPLNDQASTMGSGSGILVIVHGGSLLDESVW